MAKFPTIKNGRLSVPDFNFMSRTVGRLDEKDSTRIGRGGLNSGLLPEETVVLIQEPTEGDVAMRVRGVRYGTARPSAGVYQWDGPKFNVFPEFGFTAIDYVDAFHDSATVPDMETTFLKARKVNGVWIAALPGKGGGGTTIAQFIFNRLVESSTSRPRGADFFEANKLTDTGGLVRKENGAVKTFKVGLPNLLRRLQWDSTSVPRGTIRYSYASANTRTATSTVVGNNLSEKQVITPNYEFGDFVHAMHNPEGLPIKDGDEVIEWYELPSERMWMEDLPA